MKYTIILKSNFVHQLNPHPPVEAEGRTRGRRTQQKPLVALLLILLDKHGREGENRHRCLRLSRLRAPTIGPCHPKSQAQRVGSPDLPGRWRDRKRDRGIRTRGQKSAAAMMLVPGSPGTDSDGWTPRTLLLRLVSWFGSYSLFSNYKLFQKLWRIKNFQI